MSRMTGRYMEDSTSLAASCGRSCDILTTVHMCSNLECHEEPPIPGPQHQHTAEQTIVAVRRSSGCLEKHVQPDHPQFGPYQHLRYRHHKPVTPIFSLFHVMGITNVIEAESSASQSSSEAAGQMLPSSCIQDRGLCPRLQVTSCCTLDH